MTSIGEVYFALDGDDFEPDDVSNYIGIAATKVRRKGSKRAGPPALPRASGWEFSLGRIEDEAIDVYAMSEALIDQLLPNIDRIVEVKAKFGLTCRLQVVLWIDQDDSKPMPALGFERKVIDFLHTTGAAIDIDSYRN
jgi:hypothetical protein